MDSELKKKIEKIKVLALDIDGVMTNGKIFLDGKGLETKVFDVQDGFAVATIKKFGIKTAIISGRSAEAVTIRGEALKIDRIFQNAYPKMEAYRQMLQDFQVTDEEVCFVGDDLPDLCLLKRVGFAVAVKNAAFEAKEKAHYVTQKCGGDGAVREVVEMILKVQGHWDAVVQSQEGQE